LFFNSLSFIFLFLPVVVISYYLIGEYFQKEKYIQFLLIFASLFFYFLLTPEYLPLLLASIAFNYIIGLLLFRTKQNTSKKKWMLHILCIGLIGDLGLLGYYKYFNFAIINLDQLFDLSLPVQEIILPLGISFFTFTQIAFLVDTYRGYVDHLSFLSYIQFVTFFPHLIAGPIYHHSNIIPQFENISKRKLNFTNINLGMFFFFFGLAKKVVIADTMGSISTLIFSAVSAGGVPMLFEAWIGALAYTIQIYFDFSGYCDMAVGIALLFNIRFPVNFYSPYKVTSLIDFWRCWHITLSNFLRDYLYIPLGGNRYGLPVEIRNLMITMLLGGLWHGAGWTFVIWGGLHGVFLVINHLWRKIEITVNSYFCWFITFLAIVTTWVFFRADSVDTALSIIKGMVGLNGINMPNTVPDLGFFTHSGILPLSNASSTIAILGISISLFIALLLPNLYQLTKNYETAIINQKQYRVKLINPINISLKYSLSIWWCILVAIIAVLGIISVQSTSEFLYFQF